MKNSINCLVTLVVLTMAAFTQAEIYEGKDAEGNVIFSDTPVAGSKEVNVQKTNTADAMKSRPADTSTPERSQPLSQPHSNVVVIPDSHNEQVERDAEADRPYQVLDAEEPYEVGDEPTEAELRRRKAARDGEVIENVHRAHVKP